MLNAESTINMDQADHILTQQIRRGKTPSVQYIIFNRDNIIHNFQSGYADIKDQKAVNWDTTYNAFSVTKTFTALAIMQLVEKGALGLDDNVTRYLTSFPYFPGITIRQLLAHSSGIPNPNPLSWIHPETEHRDFDRNEFFDHVLQKHAKAKSGPGEKYSYANLGYILLGQIIESVSGTTYEDYIRENILKPIEIGPGELDFEIHDKSRHAKGYQKRFSLMNGVLGFFIDKKMYMDVAEGKWKPFKNYYVNGAPYGGLIGTPDGFRKYILALLKADCMLISDEYKAIIFTENLTNSHKPTGMCLSWFRGALKGQIYFAHAGGGGGYYDEIRIYPDLGIGSVIMYNRSGMRDERILDKLDKYFIDRK